MYVGTRYRVGRREVGSATGFRMAKRVADNDAVLGRSFQELLLLIRFMAINNRKALPLFARLVYATGLLHLTFIYRRYISEEIHYRAVFSIRTVQNSSSREETRRRAQSRETQMKLALFLQTSR